MVSKQARTEQEPRRKGRSPKKQAITNKSENNKLKQTRKHIDTDIDVDVDVNVNLDVYRSM